MKILKINIFCTLICVLFIISCSRNPVTGKREVMLMSQSQEIALGAQSDPSIIQQYGLYPDQKLQDFIDARGQEMVKVSHRSDLAFSFRLLDSPVVNAFAVPGGYVYFTRGIMAHFNNEAEFAGVLGHEIGHVTARHSAKQQTSQMLGNLGFMVGAVASEKFRTFAQEAQQGMGLLFLKFGRDHESQSDKLGVEYSTAVGYDSHEMADFFQTLNRLQSKSGQSIPDFLSTHPNPVNRFNVVHKLSDAAQANVDKSKLKVNRDEYLAMIDGMVYGEDPRQGYLEYGTFYHPALKFKFPVPVNWQLYNSPTQVQMAPEDGKAMMIFTLSPEKTLDAAVQAAVKQFNLTVLENRRDNVNGLSAIAMVSDQIAEGATEGNRILSYFIQKGDLIYLFHGVSAQKDFNAYTNGFKTTMTNFKELTEASKINVEPAKILIKTVRKSGTLSGALKDLGASSRDLEELAVLNGMELSENIRSGSKLKLFSKQVNK